MSISVNIRAKKLLILAIIIVIAFSSTVIWTMVKKAPDTKKIGLLVNKEGVKIEIEYGISAAKEVLLSRRPEIFIKPRYFGLSYPNPNSPTSLHGTFVIGIENRGSGDAMITEIAWTILDGNRVITPPSEWSKIARQPDIKNFILPHNAGLIYTYGPEITASGKDRITLSIQVKYKDIGSQEQQTGTAYYTGILNYDKGVKVNYAGNEFVTVNTNMN